MVYQSHTKSLDRIILNDLSNPASTYELKRYELEYSSAARNLIKSVTEKSGNNTQGKKYTLEYYNENSSLGDIRSVDFWGYYNGKPNGTTMLQSYGANRRPDFLFAQYFALKKITYPTGGSSTMKYAPNTGSYKQGNAYTISNTTVEYYQFEWIPGANNYWELNGTYPDVVVNATDTETYYYIELHAPTTTFVDQFCVQSPTYFLTPGTYPASYFKPDNGCISELNTNSETHCYAVVTLFRKIEQGKVNHQGDKMFSVGGIRINEVIHNPLDSDTTSIQYTYQDFAEPQYSSGNLINSIHFGLAISGSSNADGVFQGGLDKSTPFNAMSRSPILYTNVTENKAGSIFKKYHFSGFDENEQGGKDYFGTQTSVPLNSGGSVYFNTGAENIGNYDDFGHLRGVPIKTESYNGNQISRTTIQTKKYPSQNNLLFADSLTYRTHAYYYELLWIGEYTLQLSTVKEPEGALKHYTLSSVWPRLLSEVDSTFSPNGDFITSSAKENVFGNSLHKQVTEVKNSQSDGSTIKTVFKYPQDYSGTIHAVYQSMIDSNIISLPIETLKYKAKPGLADKLFDARINTFRSIAGNTKKASLVVPHNVYSFLNNGIFVPYSATSNTNSSSSYREILSYNHYNSVGNPLELSYLQFFKYAYLWAYKGQYLAAQIENSDYSELNTALADIGQSFNSILSTTDGHSLKGHLANLSNHSSLSDAAITLQTFHPIFGLTYLSLPDNSIQYFEYDKLGRLSLEKDKNNNIKGYWKYHYFNSLSKAHTLSFLPRIATSDTNQIVGLYRYNYFDGLGVNLQKVGKAESPLNKDIILESYIFDSHRRPYKSYLPTATNTSQGSFQINIQSLASSFYTDSRPFSEVTVFDNSLLGRVVTSYEPGISWFNNGKHRLQTYTPNELGARLYLLNSNGDISYTQYPPNSLSVENDFDEHNNVKVTAKDIEGNLVLIKVGDAVTSFIHDDNNRIKAVIQPEGYALNNGIAYDSDNFKKYVFFYEYDAKGRLIRKHIPGAGWTEIVYDRADRPVMTQDASQKTLNRWSFTQYDARSRIVVQGEMDETL